MVKVNPLAAWTDEEMQDYIDAQRRARQYPLSSKVIYVDRLRTMHGEAGRRGAPTRAAAAGPVSSENRMRAARILTFLIVWPPHGSADPRSAAVDACRYARPDPAAAAPWLDVRPAFLRHSRHRTFRDVLVGVPGGTALWFRFF